MQAPGASYQVIRTVTFFEVPRAVYRRSRGVFAKLLKTAVSFVVSVRPPALKSSSPAGWLLVKFFVGVITKIFVKTFVCLKSDKNSRHFTLTL
jgi:hypothetical protein